MADESTDIKKAIEQKKATIGTELTIKNLKLANLAKIYLSSNCPANVKKDVVHYAKINGTKVVQLKLDNEELGVLCKKPFFISVLGVKK